MLAAKGLGIVTINRLTDSRLTPGHNYDDCASVDFTQHS